MWFSPEDDRLFTNRGISYLRTDKHLAMRALLDAQDAYETSHCKGVCNYKAINLMIDAALVVHMRPAYDVGEILSNERFRKGCPASILSKFLRVRASLSSMAPWSVWTALGPSGLGMRACGQSWFGMQHAADIAYDDAVPLYIRSGFIFHEQNLDALSRTFVGAASRRGCRGVSDLLVCQYRARAASNAALWPDALACGMALFISQPVKAYLLALIVELRWKDDEPSTARPPQCGFAALVRPTVLSGASWQPLVDWRASRCLQLNWIERRKW